jgi:hypothetical protein
MRTTLDLDEDILQAARELAALHRTSMGRVVSDLVRRALAAPVGSQAQRNGVPLLPPRPDERPVTMEDVNRLRDEP